MQQGGYTFQARPRSVPRAKYRQGAGGEAAEEARGAANIMHDPRVVRGSTYAGRRQTALQMKQQQQQVEEEEERRRRGESRRSRGFSQAGARAASRGRSDRPVTPGPVEGRQHMEVQTTTYLEDLVDRPAETEISTQTDPAKDRPVTPLFVPRPSGESKSTSIAEGDLFDFDLEVEPILEVLVGKVLDYGLMEVLEEEELRALQQHRSEFEHQRNAAVAVNQRLDAAEKRRHEEKDRRLAQARARVRLERQKARDAAARTEAKSLLYRVQEAAILRLEQAGHFYDPVVREVEEQFVPWLAEAVAGRVSEHGDARRLVDDLVRSACEQLDQRRAEVAAARKVRLAELAEEARVREEEERKRAAEEAERKRLEAEARRAAEEAGEEDEDEDDEE